MNAQRIKRALLLLSLFTFVASTWTYSHVTVVAARNAASASDLMDWSVAGPMGGDVRSLVIDSQDPLRLYLGTLDGQMYSSTDGGQQWSRLAGFNRPGLYIDHIIVDPRNSQTIYVAAHRHKEPGGFFKTTDGGATWRDSTELQGEALHSLTQASANHDILIVGTNRGIFRSTNAGDSWEQLPTDATPGLINIESLAIDPRNADVIYAGTWYLPYKTIDGGKTWSIIKTGMIDDSDVFAIEIDELKPDHVIASACSGIYESRNGGNNWRKVNGIPSTSRRTRAIVQHPSVPNMIFAGTTEGFWRSTDGGDRWMLTTSKLIEINAIAVHPKNPQIIYIGTNNNGVMISRDGGKTFAPSNQGYSGRRAYSILPDREKPNRVYATTINTARGGGGFFISDDGGVTWQPSMRKMPKDLSTYSILQDQRDGNLLYLGTNLGVYYSLDRGASWASVNAPKVDPQTTTKKRRGRRGSTPATTTASANRTSSQTNPVATTNNVATRGGDVVNQETRSRRVAPAQTSQPSTVTPAATDPRRAGVVVLRSQEALATAGYQVGAPDGALGARTVAAIKKFQKDRAVSVSGKLDDATLVALGLGNMLTNGEAGPLLLSEAVNALVYTGDERDGRLGYFAITNNGLYRTYDLLQSWEKLPYGEGVDVRTLCISVSVTDPKTIHVGTATSGVLMSRDAGATWQQIHQDIFAKAPINIIKQDPQRPANIYVGTTQTLYFSQDNGETWTRRGGGLPVGSYTSVLINPQDSDEIFVGNAYEGAKGLDHSINAGGVFRSTDAGMTWQRVDPELPSRRVWALAFDARSPGRMFIGSHSAGVYVAQRRDGGQSASSVPGTEK